MAVGPLAPASTAMIAMTITLSSGCSRFTDDRGSSNCLKCRTTSFTSIRTILAIARPPFQIENKNTETMVYHITRKSASLSILPKLPRVRAGPGRYAAVAGARDGPTQRRDRRSTSGGGGGALIEIAPDGGKRMKFGKTVQALEANPTARPLSPFDDNLKGLAGSFWRPGERLPLVVGTFQDGRVPDVRGLVGRQERQGNRRDR